MDAKRLFKISYKLASQNNLRYIPYPKKPFNSNNQRKYFKEVENFLLTPHYNYLYKHNENYKIFREVDIKKINDIFKK